MQARYDLAVEAIQAFHTGVSEDFLLKQDQFKELRDRLLRSAQDFYGKLSALLGRETDPASRRALLASNFELADLTGKVGGKEDALKAHRAVLAAREALAAEPGADAAATVDVGRSLTEVAGLLEATGKTGEALATYRRSESLLSGPAGTDAAARAALADCRCGWDGSCRARAGPPTRWPPTGRRGPTRRRWPPPPGPRPRPAATWRTRSTGSASCWRRRAGRRRRRPSSAGRWRSGRSWPPTTPPSPTSAAAWRQPQRLGILLTETGRPSEAEAEYRRALAILREAGRRPPRRHRLPPPPGAQPRQPRRPTGADGPADGGGGRVPPGAGDRREAGRRQPRRHRLPRHPGEQPRQPRPSCWRQTGRPTEAEAEHRRALAIREKLAADNPKVPVHRDAVAVSHTNLSVILRRLGRPTEARDGCDQAIAIREALVREVPKVPMYRSHLAYSYRRRGLARGDLGDFAGAAADARRALALWEGLPSRTGQEWFETACAAPRWRAWPAGPARASRPPRRRPRPTWRWPPAQGRGRWATAAPTPSAPRTPSTRSAAGDDFRLLMMDLVFPAEPFAAAR